MTDSARLNKQFDNAKQLANSLPPWMKEIGQKRVQTHNQEIQSAQRKIIKEQTQAKEN